MNSTRILTTGALGIGLMLIAGCATPQGAGKNAAYQQSDLEELGGLMDYSFATLAAEKKATILDRRIFFDSKIGPGIWYYGQLNTGKKMKIYRQRIHNITLSDDGAAIIQNSYALNAPKKYADAWNNPALLTKLQRSDFKSFAGTGCEMRWTRGNEGMWEGYVNPKTCKIFSQRRQRNISIESEARLSSDTYLTNERGYDAQGKLLWGTKPGEFIMLGKTTP